MPATTVRVSTAAQLAAAIKSARGGETILLAPGNYGAVAIKGRMLSETVTIKSADAANDAVLTDLRIDASSGFRVEDVDVVRPLKAGEATHTVAAYISSSSNIALADIDFRGSLDGNAGNDGVALRVTGGSAISVAGSTFEQFSHAGLFSGVRGLSVTDNALTGVAKSFALSTLQGGAIAGNRLNGVKADWNLADSRDVAVRDNVVTGVGDTPIRPASTGGGGGVGVGVGVGGVVPAGPVTTKAQLDAALAVAKGGETILLAPGDYGALTIKGRTMTAPVTIKSADPANDARFSDIRIHEASGFVFDDVDVHRPLKPGEGDWTQAVYVSSSSRIAFVGVDFSGSLDGTPWNDGMGLRISDSRDVRVIDSTFEQWNNAAVFMKTRGLIVAGNTVTDVREGFDFAAVDNVTIAQNRMTGFDPNYAKGDHSDAIQFWTAGVDQASHHVVIRDNVILQGANGGTQGIFIRAENPVYRHSDFLIENNLYNGDARHGITAASIDGVVIRGNTVTSAPGGYLEAGININNSSRAVVESNIAPLLLQNGVNPGIVLRDNIDLWDSKTKQGLSLDAVFETQGDLYVARGPAGFEAIAGIGALSFDLGVPATLGHLTPAMLVMV